MDYNASQAALSPCQIGIMQANLNSCLQSRYVYKCNDCLPTRAVFELPESTCGSLTNIWLDGRATFRDHSFTLDIDLVRRVGRTPVPPTPTHYSTTGNQPVGRQQLDAVFTFQPNSTYRVKLSTFNNCGSTAVCVKYLTTVCTANALTGTEPLPATGTIAPTSSPTRHD